MHTPTARLRRAGHALLVCACGFALGSLPPLSSALAKKPPAGKEVAESGGGAAPTPAAPAPVAPPAAPAATGEPVGIPALLAAADDITRQVAALRGLEPKRPVTRGVLSREEIGAKLKERIGIEYTPDEIRIESRVLKRLGLLPDGTDYQQLLIDLLMEQVAGFYDPFARRLYIADWLGLDLQRPAMAHEIEHALQDQHFDLKNFAVPIKDDGDRQLARSALVEGDGTAAMLEFVAQSLSLDVSRMPGLTESLGKQLASGTMNQSPVFTRAPRFLRETLLFPYFAGMSFVLSLKKKDQSWTHVDDAFRAPPESTEQIIHPEKYAAHERPVAITPTTIGALAPMKELRRDVLGELELKILFASKLPDATAEAAAQGWGGDRLVAYGVSGPGEDNAPVVLVDLSAWDTDEDARQAEAAFRQLFGRQVGLGKGPAATPQTEPAVFEMAGREAWSVERRGKQILTIFGVPTGQRAPVSQEVWADWKVAAPPKRSATGG